MLHLALAALLAIDPAKSTVTFSVQHIFVERVNGSVPVLSGTIDLAGGLTCAVQRHGRARCNEAEDR